MRIDKDKLKAMAALSDAELWSQIKAVAAQHGLSLPDKSPSHADLEKVRAAMMGDKINVGGALRVIDKYRKEQK